VWDVEIEGAWQQGRLDRAGKSKATKDAIEAATIEAFVIAGIKPVNRYEKGTDSHEIFELRKNLALTKDAGKRKQLTDQINARVAERSRIANERDRKILDSEDSKQALLAFSKGVQKTINELFPHLMGTPVGKLRSGYLDDLSEELGISKELLVLPPDKMSDSHKLFITRQFAPDIPSARGRIEKEEAERIEEKGMALLASVSGQPYGEAVENINKTPIDLRVRKAAKKLLDAEQRAINKAIRYAQGVAEAQFNSAYNSASPDLRDAKGKWIVTVDTVYDEEGPNTEISVIRKAGEKLTVADRRNIELAVGRARTAQEVEGGSSETRTLKDGLEVEVIRNPPR